MIDALEHITLNTGHRRSSPRAEVSAAAIDELRNLLDWALRSKAPTPIPTRPGYAISATGEGACLIATVFAGERPLVMVGVAGDVGQGAALWRMLGANGSSPAESWCAARLLPSITVGDMGEMQWLGDFERCLAWAWVDMMEER